jgi:hypothetical protein
MTVSSQPTFMPYPHPTKPCRCGATAALVSDFGEEWMGPVLMCATCNRPLYGCTCDYMGGEVTLLPSEPDKPERVGCNNCGQAWLVNPADYGKGTGEATSVS